MFLSGSPWKLILQEITCIGILAICFTTSAIAQYDTLPSLKEVIITGKQHPVTVYKAAVVQTFNASDLEELNVLQASDAVRHFAGVTVRDYGGIGGLKTVSVRSLGANHTGVIYDGLALSENQSGQIDLGRISMEGVGLISLINANEELRLNTARAMAYGSLIILETAHPVFADKEKVNGKLGIKAGSFGFFNPVVQINGRMTEKSAITLNTEYLYSNGAYPFTLNNGLSTTREKRSNSDVKVSRMEVNNFIQASANSEYHIKLYGYLSERGLPGAAIFYNPFSSQRLADRNLSGQVAYRSRLNTRYSVLFNARYNYAYLRYLDPDYLNSAGKQDDAYRQHEFYGSAAALAKLNETWQLSASADVFSNSLSADDPSFAHPARYTMLTAISARYGHKRLSVQASLLSSTIQDRKSQEVKENKRRLSPSVILGYQPFKSPAFRLRLFYKDIFRMPTFNDLYFTGTGNPNLRPEKAGQVNAGITYSKTGKNGLSISGSADAYRNSVTDKIVAVPTKNLFIWTMLNIGKVRITGLDLTLKTACRLGQTTTLTAEGNWTFQKSEDITDRESRTYHNQIPYTPKNSGSFSGGIKVSGWIFNYNLLISGSRYTLGQNIRPNWVPGFHEHGLNASKKFQVKKRSLKLVAEALNLSDNQYEVIRNFPMPGRSFRFTSLIEF